MKLDAKTGAVSWKTNSTLESTLENRATFGRFFYGRSSIYLPVTSFIAATMTARKLLSDGQKCLNYAAPFKRLKTAQHSGNDSPTRTCETSYRRFLCEPP